MNLPAFPVLFLLISLMHYSHAFANSCHEPTPNTCGFYLDCLETEISCGPDGYAIGYGHKYCNRFKNQTVLSIKGEVWRSNTMSCLQYALIDGVLDNKKKPTCDEIIDIAFDSHPECYTMPESSICSLGLSDMKAIVDTIDKNDLLSPRGMKQMKIVAQTCIIELANYRPYQRKNIDPDLDIEERIIYWESLIEQVTN